MASIIEAERNFDELVAGFEPMIRDIMAAQKKEGAGIYHGAIVFRYKRQ